MQRTVNYSMGAGLAMIAAQWFAPARFVAGELPSQPPLVAGGGQVLLELRVDALGNVTDVLPLRASPPYTELLSLAAREWRFHPASAERGRVASADPVGSRVLVAGVFRPPTLYNGPTRGEPPRDIGTPSKEIPFPTSIVVPSHPPSAVWHTARAVLVELELGADGTVQATKVIRSSGNLDPAAVDAARQWTFRPARRNDERVPSVTYVVFGFPPPVMSSND